MVGLRFWACVLRIVICNLEDGSVKIHLFENLQSHTLLLYLWLKKKLYPKGSANFINSSVFLKVFNILIKTTDGNTKL